MKKLFGTDGMRGEAGRFPLDETTVCTVGQSLARHLKEKRTDGAPRIIIGRDTRESGAWLERALISGAGEAGAYCESAGVITTPGVAFLTRTLPADAGVVISASHNPYQDNGIKIFAPSGRKLDDATERLIEADIEAEAKKRNVDEQRAAVQSETLGAEQEAKATAHRDHYLNYLASEVAHGLQLDRLRIVIDCANGASSALAPLLFQRLGATAVAINDKPDGRNINLNCGSLHIEGLQQKVLEERADLGVAYDGDADRALFVDARGEFVDGDAALWVLANYLAERDELDGQTVVATVMSNIGLEIALRSRGIRLLRTDVGDKYVLEELLRTGAQVGGEQSGHIIFPRLSLAGDGMLTTICLMRAMRDTGRELHELTEGFTRYPQILVNVRVREKLPFAEMPRVASLAREIEMRLGETGRLLLRYSGTEPLARIMIEGRSQEEIMALAQSLAASLREEIGAE